MTDEHKQPSAQIASGVEGLIESVRTDMRAGDERHTAQVESVRADMREDNQRLEDRLMNAMTAFARSHAAEHAEEAADRRPFYERVEKFLKAKELADARRDGLLGAFRFVIEVVSRHAKPIAYVLGGIGALIGLATGHVQVGAR